MYQVSSTSVSKGLNPGLAILAVFIGHALVCVPAMLDGYVGAIKGSVVGYSSVSRGSVQLIGSSGINFPVYCRSAFGVRGYVSEQV